MHYNGGEKANAASSALLGGRGRHFRNERLHLYPRSESVRVVVDKVKSWLTSLTRLILRVANFSRKLFLPFSSVRFFGLRTNKVNDYLLKVSK